eukprot:Amastigsp_a176135_37.p3 type:complete len:260 gc:universal Amastigsp_a176135_37:1545-2324(+)
MATVPDVRKYICVPFSPLRMTYSPGEKYSTAMRRSIDATKFDASRFCRVSADSTGASVGSARTRSAHTLTSARSTRSSSTTTRSDTALGTACTTSVDASRSLLRCRMISGRTSGSAFAIDFPNASRSLIVAAKRATSPCSESTFARAAVRISVPDAERMSKHAVTARSTIGSSPKVELRLGSRRSVASISIVSRTVKNRYSNTSASAPEAASSSRTASRDACRCDRDSASRFCSGVISTSVSEDSGAPVVAGIDSTPTT